MRQWPVPQGAHQRTATAGRAPQPHLRQQLAALGRTSTTPCCRPPTPGPLPKSPPPMPCAPSALWRCSTPPRTDERPGRNDAPPWRVLELASTPTTCVSGSSNAPSSCTGTAWWRTAPERALRRRSAAAADHRLRRSAAGDQRQHGQPDAVRITSQRAASSPNANAPGSGVSTPPLALRPGNADGCDDVDRAASMVKDADVVLIEIVCICPRQRLNAPTSPF